MTFGLVNAPAVIQHMINKGLGKDRYELAIPYMDNLLSPSTTVDDGIDKLGNIFGLILTSTLLISDGNVV